jgi:hypothetical protein
MIVSSRATLGVYSDTVTAAEVTAVLGIEPTRFSERAGSTKPRSHWTLEVPSVDPDDDGGFEAVALLVELLRDRADALAALRPACETIIWWSGDSDGTQGGFVIPASLLADLAVLGCDLYGTAFLAETDPPDDDDPDDDD